MVIDKEKYLKEKNNLINFMIENKEIYKFISLNSLIELIEDNILLENDTYSQYYVLCSLLSKFGIFKESYDPYLGFYKILEQLDFIKGNCLEVGPGLYPRLAEVIKNRNKQNNYTLTLYDIDKIINIGPSATIIKDKFTRNTDITEFDSIWGMFPCEASIDLTLKSIKENKNLVIAFCDCNHSTKEFPRRFEKYWAEDFCYSMKERYASDIEIIEWEHYPKMKLPILIHKRK